SLTLPPPQAAEDKRTNWNKFQGSWGKRNNWRSLQGSWGKRAWNKLQGAWGKRSEDDNGDDLYDETNLEEDLAGNEEQVSPLALARLMAAAPQKRGWTLWGKRPDNTRVSPRSTNWSSLRGTWGKRSADWNKLRGAWGKRASDWGQFRGSWGKRAPDMMSVAAPNQA
ncbi:allatostatin B2-like, partial [Homarus americanus]